MVAFLGLVTTLKRTRWEIQTHFEVSPRARSPRTASRRRFPLDGIQAPSLWKAKHMKAQPARKQQRSSDNTQNLAISQTPFGNAFKEGIPGFSCATRLFITGGFFWQSQKIRVTLQESVTEPGVFSGNSGPAANKPSSFTAKTFLLISSDGCDAQTTRCNCWIAKSRAENHSGKMCMKLEICTEPRYQNPPPKLSLNSPFQEMTHPPASSALFPTIAAMIHMKRIP